MKAPNFKQLAVAASVTVAMGMSGAASAAAISSISINDFAFGMGYNPTIGSNEDSAAKTINMDIVSGTFQGGPNFDGSGNADKTAGIVGFDFGFFGPVSAYTIPDNKNDPNNIQVGVYPAPSGDITGGTMTLDLSAWTAGWNGNEFNQGGSTSGTMTISNLVDNGNGTFDFLAEWSSLIVGGPFNGNTGYWDVQGTATVVPVPAAVWLMGSGLLGLVGVARRRKAA